MRKLYSTSTVLRSLLLVLLTSAGFLSKAQVYKYTFSSGISSGAFAPLNTQCSPTIFQSGIAMDTNKQSVAVPFGIAGGFPYNCNKYTSIYINNNGWLGLGLKSPGLDYVSSFSYSMPLYGGYYMPYEGTICPFSADLKQSLATGATPQISYGIVGSNFVVEYKDVARAASAVSQLDRITFQVWLNASGQIKYVYGPTTTASTYTSGTTITVGIGGNGGYAAGGDFQNRMMNTTATASNNSWTTTIPGTLYSNTCWISDSANTNTSYMPNTTMPPQDLVFTYTPPTCNQPSAYQSTPACMDFESNWNGANGVPNVPNTTYWKANPTAGNCWGQFPQTGSGINGSPANNLGWYSTTSYQVTLPATGNTSSRCAEIHGYNHYNPNYSSATLAPVYLSDLDWYVNLSTCPSATKQVSYKWAQSGAYAGMRLRVLLSTDAGATFTQVDSVTMGTTTNTWLTRVANLGVVNSATAVLRFEAVSLAVSSGYLSDLGLDDICVSGAGSAPVVTAVAANTTICAPGQGLNSTTITASGAGTGGTYVWLPTPTSVSGAGNSVATVSPAIATTYTISAQDANCNTATTTITINVNNQILLTPTASANNVCPNGTSTISISDTSNGGPTLQATTTGYCIPVSATNPSSYYLKDFFTTGGSSNITNMANGVGITSNAYSDFYNTYSHTTVAGSTVTVNANNFTSSTFGYTVFVDWDRNGVFNTSNERVINTGYLANLVAGTFVVPATAVGAYRMRILDNYLSVTLDPCTGFLSSGTPYGEVEDYKLNILAPPSQPLTIAWTPSTYLSNTNLKKDTATNVAASVSYIVTGTDASGCSASTTVALTVSPLSSNLDSVTAKLVCAGQSTILKANPLAGGQPYTYKWFNPSGVLVSIAKSYTYTPPTTPGTYILKDSIFDACGNAVSHFDTITVATPPTIVVTPKTGTVAQICFPSGFTSDTLKATGAISYAWSPAPASLLHAPFNDTAVSSVVTNTTYVVTGTDANGCTNTASIINNYLQNYALNMLATPTNVCVGGSSTLTCSDTLAGQTAIAVGYPAVAAGYHVTGLHTATGNCIDTVKIGTTLLSSGPTCSMPSYTNYSGVQYAFKVGNSYSFTVSLVPAGYAGVWIDHNHDGIFTTSEYTSIVSNSNTGTVSITIPLTDTLGITKMRIRSSCNPLTGTYADSTLACGETQDYDVKIYNNSYTTISSISWALGGGSGTMTPTTGSPIVASNNGAGLNVYVVTTTDANGCTKNSTVGVLAAPLACTPITNSVINADSICVGGSRTLTANSTGGGYPLVYSWAPNIVSAGLSATNTKTVVVSPSVTTTYTVTISDACSPAGTCSQTYTVRVNPLPTISTSATLTTICGTGTSVFTATPISGTITGYAWTPVTNIAPAAGTTVTFTPGPSTVYTCTATDNKGCKGTTTLSIAVSPTYVTKATASVTGVGPCSTTGTTLSTIDTVAGPQVLPGDSSSTKYGKPVYSTTTASDEEIFAFNLGTINTSSPCGVTGYPSPLNGLTSSVALSYSNYTNLAPVNMVTGGTYPFTLNVGFCGTGTTTYSSASCIFVDWNRNGVFDTATERLYRSPYGALLRPSGTSNIFTGNITIPANATPGLTLMRVVIQESSTNPPAIGSGWGEAEDYLVNILGTSLYPITSYNWAPQPTSPTTGKTVNALPTVGTCYTVTATNSVGCIATSSVCITVGAVTCNPVTASATNLCSGLNDTLTANPLLGGTPYHYVWSGPGITSVDTNKLIIAPTSTSVVTNTYSVTVTDACGATCSESVTITINPKPVVSVVPIPANATVCATGSVSMTASLTSPNTTTTSFAWAPTATLTQATGTKDTTKNLTAPVNTYTITGTDGNGCKNTITQVVNFSPVFNVLATSNPVTVGGCSTPLQLIGKDTAAGPQTAPTGYCVPNNTYGGTSGDGILNVSFATMNNPSLSNVAAPGFISYASTVSAPTVYAGSTYTLAVQVNNGGTEYAGAWIDYNRNGLYDSTEFIPITVTLATNWNGSATVTIPGSASSGLTNMRVRSQYATAIIANSACAAYTFGETEDYAINIIGAPQIPVTNWTWNWVNNGTPASATGKVASTTSINQTNPTIVPYTVYTVTATNSVGCTTTAVDTVQNVILACNPVTATIDTLCSNGTSVLTAHTTGGGNPLHYVWTGSSTGAGDTLVSLSAHPVNTGTALALSIYTVTVTDFCGTVCSSTYTLKVYPSISKPTATNSIVCGGSGIPTSTVTSTAGALGTGQFWWYNDSTGCSVNQTPPAGAAPSVYYSYGFASTLPANSSIYGNASVVANKLQLTPNAVSQMGSIMVNASGVNASTTIVDFDLTTSPAGLADGLSYSFADDVLPASTATTTADPTNAEYGTGTKLRIGFDTYGTGTQAAGIYVMYGSNVPLNCGSASTIGTVTQTPGQTVGTNGVLAYSANTTWVNTANTHVKLTINNSALTVNVGGVNILTNVPLPPAFTNANKSTWAHCIKARTGGVAGNILIDTLVIQQAPGYGAGYATYQSPVTATTTFYVKETGLGGCQSLATPVTVTVSPTFTVQATGTPTSIGSCGATITLKAKDTLTGTQVLTPTTAYPTISYNYFTYSEIWNVTFGALNNTSDCSTTGSTTAINGLPASTLNSYSNYTNLAPTNYYTGTSYPLSLTIGACTSAGLSDITTVWIDLDHSGTFTANEAMYSTPYSITPITGKTVTSNITIPATALPGVTLMRVVNYYSSIVPAPASGVQNYGEAEDYLINILATPQVPVTTYAWAGGTIPTTGKQVTASTAGIYTVTATNSLGCITTASVTITANPMAATLTQTVPAIHCAGSNDTLSVNITGGGAPYTIAWSPTTGITTTTDSSKVNAKPASNIVYTVTVTDVCGTTITATTSVVVNPAPVIAVTPTTSSICVTGAATLTATCPTCAGTVWNGITPVNTNLQLVVNNPSSSSVYTITGTDAYGCSATATAAVNVSNQHTIAITANPTPVCNGATTTLSLVDTVGNNGPQVLPANTTTNTVTNPSVSLATTDEDIFNVTFGTLNNSSTCSSFGSASTTAINGLPASTLGSYSNYTNLPPTVVHPGSIVSGSIALSSCGASLWTNVATVWIDVNRNGYFDANEAFFTKPAGTTSLSSNIPGGTVYPFTVTIPTTAVAGLTLMRVSYNENTTNPAPAYGSISYGEFEDYLIEISTSVPATGMTYNWTPTASFATPTGAPITTLPLTATTIFTVNAVDANGCIFTKTKSVTVNAPITKVMTKANPLCNGDLTGTIVEAMAGGTAPYTVTWPAGTNHTVTGNKDSAYALAAGTYSVTITDNVGCTKKDTIVLNQPAPVVATVLPTAASCFGSNNSSAYATVTGGDTTQAYTFAWFDSVTQNQLTNIDYGTAKSDTVFNLLAPGHYQLFTSDINGCGTTPVLINFSVSQPSAPVTCTVVVDSNVSCHGGANGKITASATGGTGSTYTYQLNTGTFSATKVFTGLTAGVYTITAKDVNGCLSATTVTVTEPTAVTVAVTTTNPACNGGNGTLTITSGGGTLPRIDSVNTSAAPLAAYPAGTYSVFATDNHGCRKDTVVTIIQPTAVTLAVTTTNPACNGGNGTLTITSGGGTLPRKDSVNTSAAPLVAYPAGTYSVFTTDNHGCRKDTVVTIIQPTAVTLAVTTTNPACNGGNGTLTITSGGGILPRKDSVNTSLAPLSAYPAGTYSVFATDNHGCRKDTVVTIIQPTAVTLAVTTTNPACNGGNGTLTITSGGGTLPRIDSVNTSAAPLAAYPAGTYSVFATDNHGCRKDTVVTIIQPTAVTLAVSTTNPACNGGNGTLTITSGGGTLPRIDSVNTSAAPLSAYPAGTYSVFATDNHGCRKDTVVTIIQPTAVTLAVTTTNPACNGGNGTLTITSGGGTLPRIDSVNTSAAPLAAYPAGTYSVFATDNHGCRKDTVVTIIQPTAVTLAVTTTNPACNGGNGTLTITSGGGTLPRIDSVNTSAAPLAAYPAGTYSVFATDNHGCRKDTVVTIIQPTAVTLAVTTTNPACNGGNGTLTITSGGGTLPLIDSVNTSAAPLAAYPAGTYSVFATDNHGCRKDTVVTIIQPTAVTLVVTTTNPACNGGNGTLTITSGGGTGTITDSVNTSLAPLSAYPVATYTVFATDFNGCRKDTIVTITEPTAVTLAVTTTNPVCNGANGTLTITSGGGTMPRKDSVNTSVAPLAAYPAGTYSVSTTDNNGCRKDTVVTLTDPAVLAISANASSTTICNNTSTLLTATGTGLTFTWMPGSKSGATDTVTPSATTIYTVIGTNGTCSNSATVTINVNNANGQLSQATSSNMLSTPGTLCTTSLQPDGSTVSYYGSNCDIIATVQDGNGGNSLGSVTSCVTVDSTVQNVNGQPYLPRHYTITPTTSGPANVTLYYTQDDFDAYNANNGSLPDLPTTGGGTVSMCIYQYTKLLNTPGSTFEAMIPVTLTWDPIGNHWTVTFAVTGFSAFYCAACNPTASPLSVDVVDFAGRKDGNTSLLTWTTLHETNNANFVVKRGTSTLDINTTLGTVKTLAANGTSSSPLNYSYVDEKPNNGHNYYQLQQVDIDGKVNTVNKIVDVYYTDGATVTVYPNPTKDDLHVDINIDRATQATIKIMDVAGKTIKTIETDLTKGINKTNVNLGDLSPGAYLIKVTDNKGLNYSQQFRKM